MEKYLISSSKSNKSQKTRGLLTEINETQCKTYFEFKSILLKRNIVSDFSLYHTLFLLRFLRARKFDLEESVKMLINYIEWRKSIDFDSIINKTYPSTVLQEVIKHYPRGYHKTDKLGRPIYIELISKTNIGEVFKILSEEDVIHINIKDYEVYLNKRLPMCSKVKGFPIEQSLSILDVKDVSLNFALKVKDFIKKSSFISQNYYPEMLGQLFIVNAGFVFKGIWSIIKGFIDERTKNKISIEGNNYYSKLLNYVEEENIPSFLGGKCKCENFIGGCIASDVGPWNVDDD